MSLLRRLPAASALLLSLVLAACGGGGSGGGSPGTATPTGSTTLPTEAPPPASSASDAPSTPASSPASAAGCAPGDAPTVRSSAFAMINVVRTAAGLANFMRMPALDGTAQAHAQYVAANGGGSAEQPGKPCYTGYDLAQRLAGAGVVIAEQPGARPRSESVAVYFPAAGTEPGAWDMVNDLMNNLYSRVILLDPRTQQVGLGFAAMPGSQQRALVLDAALTAGSAGAGSGTWVVWPRDGATGLPTQMRASNLKPLGDGVTEGYPASVHAADEVQIGRFAMSEAATGAPVRATIVTAASDPNLILARGEAALVPEAPLAAGTTYRVELDGLVGGQPLHMNWTFTTAP